MPITLSSYRRAAVALLVAALAVVGLLLLGLHPRPARAAMSEGQLEQQIGQGQSAVSGLSGEVAAASGRVAKLSGGITRLEAQIEGIQLDLDAKRAALVGLRGQLAAARARLAQLIAFNSRASDLLSRLLVAEYENDRPDLVTVVLNSSGFSQLLERLNFRTRIQRQDVAIIQAVRVARRAVSTQATRLGALEVRQQALTEQVLRQRDALAVAKVSLVGQEIAAAQVRDAKAGQLAGARARVSRLEGQLRDLRAAEAARAAALARAAAAAAAAATPSSAAASSSAASGGATPPVSASQVSSAGGFTFPLPRGSVSGPGGWSPDDGVDMSAAGDTPEFAVCSGTIVLHGIGGFGPWAPVIHCDSPLDGYSYVYYGHAGPADQLPVGTHVSAGEVMSSIGPGIVGISTGPHIEIGFCDGSGTPIGPSSAGAMMSLLSAAY